MTEYKLEVQDTSDPRSRLVFLNRLEKFLGELKKDDTIQGYLLKTPYNHTTIFKVEAIVQ